MGRFRYKQHHPRSSDSQPAPARAPGGPGRHKQRQPRSAADPADELRTEADALRQQGRWDEALELYEKLLDLKPERAPDHVNLGVALQNQQKLDLAVRCYRKVMALDPNLPAVHNNLGSV